MRHNAASRPPLAWPTPFGLCVVCMRRPQATWPDGVRRITCGEIRLLRSMAELAPRRQTAPNESSMTLPSYLRKRIDAMRQLDSLHPHRPYWQHTEPPRGAALAAMTRGQQHPARAQRPPPGPCTPNAPASSSPKLHHHRQHHPMEAHRQPITKQNPWRCRQHRQGNHGRSWRPHLQDQRALHHEQCPHLLNGATTWQPSGQQHQISASSVWTNGDLANLIDNLSPPEHPRWRHGRLRARPARHGAGHRRRHQHRDRPTYVHPARPGHRQPVRRRRTLRTH